MDVKPAKRRRFRYSLRGLMLLILVICVVLGYFVERDRRQRLVVKAIKEARGKVAYDYEFVKGDYQAGRQPWEPKWLLRLTGIDFFHGTKLVIIKQRDFSEEEAFSTDRPVNPLLPKLRDLPGLRRLRLVGVFNDAEIEQLRGLTQLEELHVLGGPGLTEEGIANLSNLTNLKSLGLSCPLTDKGLSHLSGLRNLEELAIICDFGTEPITNSGLHHIRGMTKLHDLFIGHSVIDDNGLSVLQEMNRLDTIALLDSQITDAGLRHLTEFPRLKSLSLMYDDLISKEEMKRFEAARPDVKIIR